LSRLLYGTLTRALLEFFKSSFSLLFLHFLSLVSANTPSLKANPQLCISENSPNDAAIAITISEASAELIESPLKTELPLKKLSHLKK